MPYAIDIHTGTLEKNYADATGNARELSADAPLQAGWTRLLASDYEDEDVYKDFDAVLDDDGDEIAPAYRVTLRQGVCFEYERRRDEIVAKREKPVRTYSKDEYDAALQAAVDAHITSLPSDYQDRAELALLASAPNTRTSPRPPRSSRGSASSGTRAST